MNTFQGFVMEVLLMPIMVGLENQVQILKYITFEDSLIRFWTMTTISPNGNWLSTTIPMFMLLVMKALTHLVL